MISPLQTTNGQWAATHIFRSLLCFLDFFLKEIYAHTMVATDKSLTHIIVFLLHLFLLNFLCSEVVVGNLEEVHDRK